MDQSLLISWEPSNAIGIPILDEQHRGIVSSINSFNFFMQHDPQADLLLHTIFTMIDCYTKLHFATEEEFLRRSGYKEAEQHKKLHLALIHKSFSIASKSIRLHDPDIYLQFLKEWWLTHINDCDRRYAPVMAKYFAQEMP